MISFEGNEGRSMNDQHKVIVFGGSLFCKGIESSLKRQLDSVVLQIDEAQQDAEEHIHLLCPDVVIVDVVSTRWDVVVATLRKHPETMVIGLDPIKELAWFSGACILQFLLCQNWLLL